VTKTILPVTRHLSSLPVSCCAQKAPHFLLPTVTMLRPAFVSHSSTVVGEQTTLLPSAKSWTKLLLYRRATAPPCDVHPYVRPSCREFLSCREATPCCGCPNLQHWSSVVSRPPAAMFRDKPQQPSTSPLSSRSTPRTQSMPYMTSARPLPFFSVFSFYLLTLIINIIYLHCHLIIIIYISCVVPSPPVYHLCISLMSLWICATPCQVVCVS
jgi:hypothetical protein